jgi:hypothetical protein
MPGPLKLSSSSIINYLYLFSHPRTWNPSAFTTLSFRPSGYLPVLYKTNLFLNRKAFFKGCNLSLAGFVFIDEPLYVFKVGSLFPRIFVYAVAFSLNEILYVFPWTSVFQLIVSNPFINDPFGFVRFVVWVAGVFKAVFAGYVNDWAWRRRDSLEGIVVLVAG